MANASAKRIAAQNEQSIRNLRLGMLVSTFLSVALRLFIGQKSLFPSLGLACLFAVTFALEVLIYSHLVKTGSTRRDSTGNLLSPGEDLNQSGITEWCFDIIYVTWFCQVGSAVLGEKIWFFYLSIPAYAAYKIWSLLLSPMFFGRQNADVNGESTVESLSKRQQKLKARSERGDSRVKQTRVSTKRN